jgi:hypothetical protein
MIMSRFYPNLLLENWIPYSASSVFVIKKIFPQEVVPIKFFKVFLLYSTYPNVEPLQLLEIQRREYRALFEITK